MASYSIEEIEGIGPAFSKKLEKAGIRNTAQLLEHAGTKSGRGKLAETTGIAEKQILQWVNLADLMRVNGIGRQFAELLEAAGVDTVKELRHRNAENLTKAMADVNAKKNLTRAVPAATKVQDWIDAAKTTEPAVSH